MKTQYVHERDAELIRKDGLMCEAHPGLEFEHDPDCAGPGMAWAIEGKAAITSALTTAVLRQDELAPHKAINLLTALEHQAHRNHEYHPAHCGECSLTQTIATKLREQLGLEARASKQQ